MSLSLSPQCKACSPPKKSKRSTNETTIIESDDDLFHIGILLTAPSRPRHAASLSFYHSESSIDYEQTVISLASHLLERGHTVVVVVAHNRHHHHDDTHQDEKQQQEAIGTSSEIHANRIYDNILDHLHCSDRMLATTQGRLEIRVLELDNSRRMSSLFGKSTFLDSFSLPHVKGLEHIFAQEKQAVPALVMDVKNVAGMVFSEYNQIPSLLLLHPHHPHHHGLEEQEAETRIRNSKQFKSFLFKTATKSSKLFERVHASWLEFHLGFLPFMQYNYLRRKVGLGAVRRFIPDAWQAPGFILGQIQTATTTKALHVGPDESKCDDDADENDMPSFISFQGPLAPPCFPCNQDEKPFSLCPPCLSSPSSSGKTEESTAQNVILLDDSLAFDSKIAAMSVEQQSQKQYLYERKLLQALSLARESLESWDVTTENEVVPDLNEFDIIRLEDSSERDQDSNADSIHHELRPAFLKSHVAATLLDAISYYSQSSSHHRLVLVMTNRCHYYHQKETGTATPVLCIHDDPQETVRQLALRILRKLISVQQKQEHALDQGESPSTESPDTERPHVVEMVEVVEQMAQIQKNSADWKSGRELGLELRERVVAPWKTITPTVSSSQQHQQSQTRPPLMLVSMSWLIILFSIAYLFTRKVWPTLHRNNNSIIRSLQQQQHRHRHSVTDTYFLSTRQDYNGTIVDSSTRSSTAMFDHVHHLFSHFVQDMWVYLSQLDVALEMLQDWVHAELADHQHHADHDSTEPGTVSDNNSNDSAAAAGSQAQLSYEVGSSAGPRKRKNARIRKER